MEGPIKTSRLANFERVVGGFGRVRAYSFNNAFSQVQVFSDFLRIFKTRQVLQIRIKIILIQRCPFDISRKTNFKTQIIFGAGGTKEKKCTGCKKKCIGKTKIF